VDALRIKLREVLREDMGGTYGVRVQISVTRYPREEYTMLINFGASPDRVEELTSTVFTQLDSLKTSGTTDVYLNKVKESQRREREVNLKINSYWLNALESYYYNEDDPRLIARYEELVDSLTLDDIRHAAVRLLDTGNYVRIVLYPENNEQKQ
jgi:zinc protease